MADLVRYSHFIPGVTEAFGASGVTMPIPVAPPASGNSIILTIRNSYAPGDINPISVSDNQGNLYSLDLEALGRNEGLHGVFRRHNITNAPTDLVFTWLGGGSRYITANIGEWSGLANAAPLVTAHNSIVTDVTGAISTTLPSVPANSFALAFLGHGLFDITGTGSDFTRTPTGAVLNSLVYDLDTGAAGNKVVGYTGEANDTGAIFALAYANAGAGGSAAAAAHYYRRRRR